MPSDGDWSVESTVPHTYTRVPMNVPVLVQLILLKKFNLERSTFYTRFYQRCTFHCGPFEVTCPVVSRIKNQRKNA
jgi:hypothetical protein